MQIGAVSMKPYIYNTNAVSPKSLDKISAISDDITSSRLDASSLVSEESKKQVNTNPLKPGQSLDFTGIIQMQMQMSRLNASRVMKPSDDNQDALAPLKAEPVKDISVDTANMLTDDIAGGTINLLG